MFFLSLLLNQGINERAHECVECWVDCWASFFDACFGNFHCCGCFKYSLFLVSDLPWDVMGKCDTLVDRDIQAFGEFLDPKISISFRFWVVSIKNYYNSLRLFLNSRPYSLIFGAAYIIFSVTWHIPELNWDFSIINICLMLNNPNSCSRPVRVFQYILFLG